MTSSHDGFHWSKAEVERVISIQHAAEQNICHELWATRQLEIRDQGLSERCTFPGASQQEFRGLLQRRVQLDGLGHGLGGVVTHSRVPSLHTVYTVWRRRRCHSKALKACTWLHGPWRDARALGRRLSKSHLEPERGGCLVAIINSKRSHAHHYHHDRHGFHHHHQRRVFERWSTIIMTRTIIIIIIIMSIFIFVTFSNLIQSSSVSSPSQSLP